jgi:hypothetical protein
MTVYTDTIKRNAETYIDNDYSEIPDSEAYIEMALAYIRDVNANSFLDWMRDNNYNLCLAEMFYEALRSLSKRYTGQNLFSSDFEDYLLDFAKENHAIEADYELEREEAVAEREQAIKGSKADDLMNLISDHKDRG